MTSCLRCLGNMNMRNILLLLLSLSLLSACATSPEGRRQLHLFPSKQLDQMGAQSFEQLKKDTPISTHQPTIDYIRCIADHIIDGLLFAGNEFFILHRRFMYTVIIHH